MPPVGPLCKSQLSNNHGSRFFMRNTLPLVAAAVAVELLRLTLVTPWTVAHQAPLSAGFPRQEYWSGLLFPSPASPVTDH